MFCYDTDREMKIDRLIGILCILLQEDKTTAAKLAERFEVSVRTIRRDIDDLCLSGIPIQTIQGKEGGIRIMEGYRMDRSIFTNRDLQMILAGLRSLDSVSNSNYCSLLMEKIKAGSSRLLGGRDYILIDLSSWRKDELSEKIALISEAIELRQRLSFHYYAPNGESDRCVEPYYLLFHWSSWYLWAWCSERKDYRLFRLSRMADLEKETESFMEREAAFPELSDEQIFKDGIPVKVLFDRGVKWRLIEEFSADCITEKEDGKVLFEGELSDMDSLISWLLSFKEKAEVLEPPEAREKMREVLEEMTGIYADKMEEENDGL